MTERGRLNRKGLQYLRAASLVRPYGSDAGTVVDINVGAGSKHTIGFTSGIPATEAITATTSGFTIPAQGTYEVEATVYVSGITPGVNYGQQAPEYSISLSLDGTDVVQSIRTIPQSSGVRGSLFPSLTPLHTHCVLEAQAQDVLAVNVISNAAAGAWRLVGSETVAPKRGHALATPAAVLTIRRLPGLSLSQNTYLQ